MDVHKSLLAINRRGCVERNAGDRRGPVKVLEVRIVVVTEGTEDYSDAGNRNKVDCLRNSHGGRDQEVGNEWHERYAQMEDRLCERTRSGKLFNFNKSTVKSLSSLEGWLMQAGR